MRDIENRKIYSVWLKLHVAAVFCFFVYFALYQFAPNYLGALYPVVYKLSALALIACFLFFRRLKDGSEFVLIFLYCLWVTLMRLIDGSFTIEGVPDSIVNLWIILPYLGFAFLLSPERRMKMLDMMAVIYCAAYTVLGVLCVYAAPNQLVLINPLTGTEITEFVSNRLFVFWKSCNTTSAWFLISLWLLVYLFFRCRRRGLRILIIPAILINYMSLALTFSRSAQMGFAIGAGMLAAAAALRYLPLRRISQKAAVLAVVLCIFSLAAYKGFSLSVNAVNIFSRHAAEAQTEVISAEENKQLKKIEAATEGLNNRGLNSSGRTKLWLASLKTLAEHPSRLITGKYESIIDTNSYIAEHAPKEYARYKDRLHHHNAYLETLLYSGVPGFLVIMAFFVLLTVKMVRIFFCEKAEADMAVKTLTILLTGLMIYNFFESSLLHIYDLRSVVFFVTAGYVLAFEKELCAGRL